MVNLKLKRVKMAKGDAQKIIDEVSKETKVNTSNSMKFTWKKISLTLGILLVISIAFNFMNADITGFAASDNIGETVKDFIEMNYAGTTVSIGTITETNGLFEVQLNLVTDQGTQAVTSYVTKDGALLFPSAIPLTTPEATDTPSQPTPAQPTATNIQKSDKPVVELFVMSHCPFGTQAEKGMLPVAELLGDNIDFEIKFVNYAMHGEKELAEQMNQVCIQEEQNDKWNDYLWCFLEAGDGEKCLAETKIDTTKLDTCTTKLDKDFKIMELFADESTWSGGRFPQFPVHDAKNKEYGVRGSPTLVINGQQVSSSRDSASYLANVCVAFNNAPEECSEQLSSVSPSSGFGLTDAPATAGSNAATCG
jgi:hypothetical protein